MTTHPTSGAADPPEVPTTFCWATELAMTQEPVTLSVAESREISAEMQRLHALAAGQAVAPSTIAIPRETLISWSQCCAQCLSLRVQMEIDEILYPDEDTPARPAPPAMDGGAQQVEGGDAVRWCGHCGEGITFFCRSKTVCECPMKLGRIVAQDAARAAQKEEKA